ncbi:site-specific integrase [Streptomyces sp. LN704]|uniref:site-specific integrase n=1 Tax=Streptomyces sp. LN704 TaxID=3112982 RepID=UPI0037233E2A
MADRVPDLAGWQDSAGREDRVGIHPGDPILLSPDYGIDEVLSRYLCRSSFARLAPETKRNYTDDYCLFFDFLWGRGKTWREATADDLWDFEDWRTRSLRNPRRVGGSRWNRGLAALARLYEWAVQREQFVHRRSAADGSASDAAGAGGDGQAVRLDTGA